MPSIEASQLTRRRAVALLEELAVQYSEPEFQRKFRELSETHKLGRAGLAARQGELVREKQAQVLPKFGFEASDEGVRRMMSEFGRFANDAEVQQLAVEVEDALMCDASRGFSKEQVTNLLGKVISAMGLQEEKVCGVDPDIDYLEARIQAALAQETQILQEYGFPIGGREAARRLLVEVGRHLHDQEVSSLFDGVTRMMGMTTAASLQLKLGLGVGMLPQRSERAATMPASDARAASSLGMPCDLDLAPDFVRSTKDRSVERYEVRRQTRFAPEKAHFAEDCCGTPSSSASTRTRSPSASPSCDGDRESALELLALTRAALEAKTPSLSRHRLLSLLREQLSAYSEPDFQCQVRQLKEDVEFDASPTDCYYLPGRVDLEVSAMQRTLASFGLERSAAGMCRLREECALHAEDPEVERLILAVCEKLMMEPLARRRYVDRLRADAGLLTVPTAADTEVRNVFVGRGRSQAEAPLEDSDEEEAEDELRRGALASVVADPPPPRSLDEVIEPLRLAPPQLEGKRRPACDRAPGLTRGLAEALVHDLDCGLRAWKSKQRAPASDKDQPESSLLQQEVVAISRLLREVLPRYRFDGSEEGLRLAREAAMELVGEEAFALRATALFDELLTKLKSARPKAAAEAPPVQLDFELAYKLHRDLLHEFTTPAFQKRLNELYRSRSAFEPEFGEAFAELTLPVLDAAHARYGLPAASEDLAGVCALLAPFYAEGDAVVSALEEALFCAERPGTGPGLLDVVGALREQLGCFAAPQFQVGVDELTLVAEATGYKRHVGLVQATLHIQEEVLPRYGFEGSCRGGHAMLALASRLLWVPQVAALFDAINAKLGMAPDARKNFMRRIRQQPAPAGSPDATAA